MRITVLANPRSGRGRAIALAGRLEELLRSRGHTVPRPDLSPTLDLADAAEGSDRLVIVGGDGTVHHAAGAAAATGIPVYHLATGTENLFARYFGMPKDPRDAAEKLEMDHPPFEIDLGSVNGVPFALMCSLGVDASVIHRVDAVRGVKGGHLSYIRPSIAEGLRPRPARLLITGDGQPVAGSFVGTAVVANIPAYALGMDPCFDADPSDGRLDLALLPATTTVGTAMQFLRCRLRSRAVRRVRAAQFEIRALPRAGRSLGQRAEPGETPGTGGVAVQIDGERPRPGSPLVSELTPGDGLVLSVWPVRMRVHGSLPVA